MGTPKPEPVDEGGFITQIALAQATLASGAGILLVLLGTVLMRALRERRWPRFSLARLLVMVTAAGTSLMGCMHWVHSMSARRGAARTYEQDWANYQESLDAEQPAHEVTLPKPFYMGKFTVTQEQYQQVTGRNPSNFKGENHPVEQVSWVRAQEFCKGLGDKDGVHARLPTEAEWEYACRAGTRTRFFSGDGEWDLDRVAWYVENSNLITHPVGRKEANAFGLYDMHGNVWQWCHDFYGNYTADAAIDPQGSTLNAFRVIRGGAWCEKSSNCRSALRRRTYPGDRHFSVVGFRVVLPMH